MGRVKEKLKQVYNVVLQCRCGDLFSVLSCAVGNPQSVKNKSGNLAWCHSLCIDLLEINPFMLFHPADIEWLMGLNSS